MKKTLLVLFVFLSVNVAAEDGFKTNFTSSNLLFILLVSFFVLTTYLILNFTFKTLKSRITKDEPSDQLTNSIFEVGEKKRVFLYLCSIFIVLITIYLFTKDTSWEAHVSEWLNLIIRWTHVVFGIAWIGASFYFNFLENGLNRTENLREELAGNLWAVHGGGFYYLEKYKVAPKKIPKDLHWFKYEAYFTWLSGFTLLIVVYYLNANVYLIDPEVLDISQATAIAIGVGSLLLGWYIYDLLCKSPLRKTPKLFWFILFAFLVGFTLIYLNVFSARAAYIHIGALIGTMMVGNVFFVIIPAQKAMVSAARKGELPDPQLGKNGLLRSKHNNYLTLPVIFIMISNHFPSTYGNSFNWIILIGLSLTSVLVKEYLNKIEKGEKAVWILPLAIVGMISMTFVSGPKTTTVCEEDVIVTYSEVQPIIANRCVQCHSESPTDDEQKIAPNGVKFDTPEECVAMADRILFRAVTTKTMPQANKTGITQAERNLIECWVKSGANI